MYKERISLGNIEILLTMLFCPVGLFLHDLDYNVVNSPEISNWCVILSISVCFFLLTIICYVTTFDVEIKFWTKIGCIVVFYITSWMLFKYNQWWGYLVICFFLIECFFIIYKNFILLFIFIAISLLLFFKKEFRLINIKNETITAINLWVNLNKGKTTNVKWNINRINSVNFSGLEIIDCDFSICRELDSCHFEGAKIYNSSFTSITIEDTKFTNTSFYDGIILNYAPTLIDAVFFKRCSFIGTDFRYANATETIFSDCTFDKKTNFEGMDLTRVRIINPNGLDTSELKEKIFKQTTKHIGLTFEKG